MPLDQVDDEPGEMSFLDHLEELRWHLIRSLTAIFVFAIAAFVSKGIIFGEIILGPSKPSFWTYRMLCNLSEILNSDALCISELPFIIQSRQMTGQFSMHITSSFVIGLICAFPYAFWEIWRFVKPGLYDKERKAATGATFYVSLLFFMGVFFGYFVVTPISINFLSNYQIDPSILNEFDIISYVSTVTTLVLACALLFQLPIVVYFATKAGLVSSSLLKTYRKHSIIVILMLSAVLTPPDPFSQVLIAIPLGLLYQLSILIAVKLEKKERKQELTKP
ncbi:twin-arginine translocase subunit TatC [Cyclobacteriaceae bacterium]|jgi:sec-independent protein translocase protein TatC|nr:twin-arginine translocase subunit TatC [Cyclobacteriaceae bacterium]MDA9906706.1 twin-arginine translocase subunit TatC [Cyclobacteriaceae bacterium]MDB4012845.1 twin-arginine translocase subunit TatC [Cyclobacteriaceae bacterium]MDB4290881.1 twin-arginine translocase subunit TatC [Cyclobacteriaceae bacterium]MDB4315245.1 twin-arginine translocase subunit TatC [Cyclobacteriaceae bacterium]|tara:strand:+ start:704 stop:1537 length:834 start_codon:yes stop_codon:yes gene_type:complete